MNSKVFIILLIVFFVGLLIGMNLFMNELTIKLVNTNEKDNYNVSENTISDGNEILHISSSNFENEVLNSDKPVLIDFYADWCEPCKIMSPIVEMIAEENENIKVVKINVDNETDLASK